MKFTGRFYAYLTQESSLIDSQRASPCVFEVRPSLLFVLLFLFLSRVWDLVALYLQVPQLLAVALLPLPLKRGRWYPGAARLLLLIPLFPLLPVGLLVHLHLACSFLPPLALRFFVAAVLSAAAVLVSLSLPLRFVVHLLFLERSVPLSVPLAAAPWNRVAHLMEACGLYFLSPYSPSFCLSAVLIASALFLLSLVLALPAAAEEKRDAFSSLERQQPSQHRRRCVPSPSLFAADDT